MKEQFFEFAVKYLTFDNLTAILAVFGSLGTLWNIIQSHKRIKLIPINYVIKNNGDFVIHLQIVNYSRLAIAITDIAIKVNDVWYSCYKGHLVAESSSHERRGQLLLKDFYTQPFPLQIVGLGGTSSHMVFELPKDIHPDFSKPLNFQVSSNRGRVVEKILLQDPTCR